MSKTNGDDFEVVRSSDNLFRDLGFADASILQFKANVALKIFDVLEAEKISVREAQVRTGYSAALFSRVRQGKLRGFTLDRLIAMFSKLLGEEVEVDMKLAPRARIKALPAEAPRPA